MIVSCHFPYQIITYIRPGQIHDPQQIPHRLTVSEVHLFLLLHPLREISGWSAGIDLVEVMLKLSDMLSMNEV